MTPRQDPEIITSLLLALVLACVTARAPGPGETGGPGVPSSWRGRIPTFLQLPR